MPLQVDDTHVPRTAALQRLLGIPGPTAITQAGRRGHAAGELRRLFLRRGFDCTGRCGLRIAERYVYGRTKSHLRFIEERLGVNRHRTGNLDVFGLSV